MKPTAESTAAFLAMRRDDAQASRLRIVPLRLAAALVVAQDEDAVQGDRGHDGGEGEQDDAHGHHRRGVHVGDGDGLYVVHVVDQADVAVQGLAVEGLQLVVPSSSLATSMSASIASAPTRLSSGWYSIR